MTKNVTGEFNKRKKIKQGPVPFMSHIYFRETLWTVAREDVVCLL